MKNYLSVLLLSLFIFNCQSNDDSSDNLQLATIESQTTINTAEITFTTIKIDGNVTSNGGSTIIERGICWSTSPNPTTQNEIIIENTNTFSTTIDNLIANTNYYFRVYATNDIGTNYGPELSFKTLNIADTNWIFTTYYSDMGDFSILSKINFYA
ncbi:MAG: fibronectin type III domain-containing protein, partial [Oceanihabitans sp.]|nr:fibronectin type III domain-containing protein [Oceanihabitans sp.]